MFKKNLILISIFIFIFSIGIVQASDNQNITEISQGSDIIENNSIEAPNLAVKTNNFKTYEDSNSYFKAKIYDKNTKKPVKNVKVSFKVVDSHGKSKNYKSKSNDYGFAFLKKNLKVGIYKVYTSINKSVKTKAKLTVKATSEMGCTSLYLQVSNKESVAGFRRDSTYAASIQIKVSKWNDRKIIKQYKTAHTYFFHTITTSDGWIIGTGGADNPSVNNAIEKLARNMVENNNIKKSSLYKIQSYERQLGIGHFGIKAPNGKFAVVWGSGIQTGSLKAGEYLKVPNSRSLFVHGSYDKFDSNPNEAAVKILASDPFGLNRRDATIFHWLKTTSNGSTSSKVYVYGANDCGSLMGRYTSHLKDTIYFKNKKFSNLPLTPNMKYLGKNNFGSIDSLKTQTVVKVNNINTTFNQNNYFKATFKNKLTKKAIANLNVKLKIGSNVYTLKTDSKGILNFNTNLLKVGKYKVQLYTNNDKYYVSAKSTIIVNNESV